MKTEMIAVYIIVVALVAVPYLLMIFLGDSSAKKVAKEFKQKTKDNKLKINTQEHWTTHRIGLDIEAKKLLFVHLEDNVLNTQLIDLHSVFSCAPELSKSFNKVDGKKVENLLLSGIGLSYGKAGESHFLKFYDASVDAVENFERQRAHKWTGLVNDQLVKRAYGQVA